MDNIEILKNIYNALSDKKAEDIKIIDISKVSVMADYFVITHGNNQSQVDSLVDAAQEAFLKAGIEPSNTEGGRNNGWTLIDANDIIVHIFTKENRDFYNIERIWKDGKEVHIEE